MSQQVGDFFKLLRPFQKSWTLLDSDTIRCRKVDAHYDIMTIIYLTVGLATGVSFRALIYCIFLRHILVKITVCMAGGAI